jgi:glycosyltransferase involved in cell wall biosynthesis
MNILCSIHLYPPKHNCGAEYMLHNIVKHLQGKGHKVRVLLHQANHYKITNNYTWDGVDVFPPNANLIEGMFRWADAVFTHLDYTRWTIHTAKLYRKPVFHLIHNSHPYPEIIDAEHQQHIIYNSEWLKDLLQYKFPNFVITPPIDYRNYDIGASTGDKITLINLNKNKGGEIFYEIAKALPNKQFLGVQGSYDSQLVQNLHNVTYIPNTPDIMIVYRQTRILLMPSEYESWGMVATEAMCSGIPVICTETPGLKENCGKAGIYVKDRNNIKAWVKAITELDDEKNYAAASRKAKARSREHDPRETLDKFECWFKEKVKQWAF